MGNRTATILIFLLAGTLAVSVSGCKLLHEKLIDLVLHSTACQEFVERHDNANYVGDRQSFSIAPDIDDALEAFDPPVERSDISEAKLTSASFEITWAAPETEHDWVIAGTVMIGYGGDEMAIASYDSVSVEEAYALGEPVYLEDLEPMGVDLFNQALSDYLAGVDPVVDLWVESDSVSPTPSPSDSLSFNWEGCIYMYVVSSYRTEVVDFFGGD
jgi:hypothetical protein